MSKTKKLQHNTRAGSDLFEISNERKSMQLKRTQMAEDEGKSDTGSRVTFHLFLEKVTGSLCSFSFTFDTKRNYKKIWDFGSPFFYVWHETKLQRRYGILALSLSLCLSSIMRLLCDPVHFHNPAKFYTWSHKFIGPTTPSLIPTPNLSVLNCFLYFFYNKKLLKYHIMKVEVWAADA